MLVGYTWHMDVEYPQRWGFFRQPVPVFHLVNFSFVFISMLYPLPLNIFPGTIEKNLNLSSLLPFRYLYTQEKSLQNSPSPRGRCSWSFPGSACMSDGPIAQSLMLLLHSPQHTHGSLVLRSPEMNTSCASQRWAEDSTTVFSMSLLVISISLFSTPILINFSL